MDERIIAACITKQKLLVGPYDPRLVFAEDGGLVAEFCRGDAAEDAANALHFVALWNGAIEAPTPDA